MYVYVYGYGYGYGYVYVCVYVYVYVYVYSICMCMCMYMYMYVCVLQSIRCQKHEQTQIYKTINKTQNIKIENSKNLVKTNIKTC